MQNVAGVIRQANADIVLLQEVENEAALGRLNAMLQWQGYTVHFAQGKDTFAGQRHSHALRLEPQRVGRVEGEGKSGGEPSQVTKDAQSLGKSLSGSSSGSSLERRGRMQTSQSASASGSTTCL